MAEDHIRYDILAQDALRGVLRKVLSEVAKAGLPGEHHFYITFATKAPGVRISSRLLHQYPEDMTIVLQYQFWDLTVTDHAFEVGLSFNGVPERLLVPFTAVKAFADPAAPFKFEFSKPGETNLPTAVPAPAAPAEIAAAKPATEPARPAPAAIIPAPVQAKPRAVKPEPEPAAKTTGEAEVVSLDAFRKKS
jgi:hypothetical protein